MTLKLSLNFVKKQQKNNKGTVASLLKNIEQISISSLRAKHYFTKNQFLFKNVRFNEDDDEEF